MTAQMSLLAPPVERLTVEPTREVVVRGASASGVPRHAHVPSRPSAMHTDEEWLGALEIAERKIRWWFWTCPHPLPLDEKPTVNGGGGGFHYDSKGVAVWSGGERRYVSWPQLLRGLREQRDQEPHIADARDLAAAYHSAETYDRYYVRDGGSVSPRSEEHRERVAIPHLKRLHQIIRDLGGDPDLAVAA